MRDLRFFINPRSALPIYQQLVDQVKGAAASGLLPAGSKMPSVRELAGDLAINPNTVARAYSILEEQGIIQRRQGSGTYVSPSPPTRIDLTPLKHKLDALMVEAYHLQVPPDQLRKLFEDALKKWHSRKEG